MDSKIIINTRNFNIPNNKCQILNSDVQIFVQGVMDVLHVLNYKIYISM